MFKTFTPEFLSNLLNECVAELHPDTEMKLHFARWAEYHDQKLLGEWPTKEGSAYTYWENHVNRLHNTFLKRPYLFWAMVKEAFKLSDAQMESYFGPRPEKPDAAWSAGDKKWFD